MQAEPAGALVNGKGTAVNGIELSYQQYLDFLPAPFDGLGVLANYTYVDSTGDEPLQGSSSDNYTLSAFYEKNRVSARLSYTYRDEYFERIEGGSQDSVIEQEFGTLDLNVTVNVTDNVSVVLEGGNLLEDTNRERLMPINLPKVYVDPGRRLLLGVRAKF